MEQIEQIITTVDIAEMMHTSHKTILQKLEGANRKGKHTEGIIEILGRLNLQPSDFFIKSSYINSQNKEMPCYKCTRKGCEFLAHKFQGEKGIEFTARYIERFHQMEDILKQHQFIQTEEQTEKQTEKVRLLPEFKGGNIEDKQLAAEFIQDYIVEKQDDAGLYRAYRIWCLSNNRTFLPVGFFQRVKNKVVELRLKTGEWKPYTSRIQIQGNSR